MIPVVLSFKQAGSNILDTQYNITEITQGARSSAAGIDLFEF